MQALEAKNFLVEQTAEQAALENVPLSDLEKRMMYFSETGECPEDPIALNDAFEAEYDTTAYEKKISRLMARAYRRIKRDNPEKLRLSDRGRPGPYDGFGIAPTPPGAHVLSGSCRRVGRY
jgi:hypothetical protein